MAGMCHLKHGMGSITEALYNKVKDSVRLSTPVKEIVTEDKKVKGVETEYGSIEADHVIRTTDAVIARQLMPNLPDTMRKPLETFKYSSTFIHMFPLEKRITPKYFLTMMIPGSDSMMAIVGENAFEGTTIAPPGRV